MYVPSDVSTDGGLLAFLSTPWARLSFCKKIVDWVTSRSEKNLQYTKIVCVSEFTYDTLCVCVAYKYIEGLLAA